MKFKTILLSAAFGALFTTLAAPALAGAHQPPTARTAKHGAKANRHAKAAKKHGKKKAATAHKHGAGHGAAKHAKKGARSAKAGHHAVH